ncbi:hypothetical protein OH76DRAFT_138400 [Lentinus brumalis]|uniref:Uncharacterized protein n=1 Tax=Lentinus brumalis TaxID=2498619 RepID=A0A371CPP5_9APHY|nr:hypothetical protein OH76DRAFT_138400 [Polyporus brumalis]
MPRRRLHAVGTRIAPAPEHARVEKTYNDGGERLDAITHLSDHPPAPASRPPCVLHVSTHLSSPLLTYLVNSRRPHALCVLHAARLVSHGRLAMLLVSWVHTSYLDVRTLTDTQWIAPWTSNPDAVSEPSPRTFTLSSRPSIQRGVMGSRCPTSPTAGGERATACCLWRALG